MAIEKSSGRRSQRSVRLHAGGACDLKCPICDCSESATSIGRIRQVLGEGPRRLVIAGGGEEPSALAELVSQARAAGVAEVVVRTPLQRAGTDLAAASWLGLGVDALLVPLFSANPSVQDRISGVVGALARTIEGLRSVSRAGLPVEIELPLLARRLQSPLALVQMAMRAAPTVRRVRVFVQERSAHAALAPPRWDRVQKELSDTIRWCRDQNVDLRIGPGDGIPFCALSENIELLDVFVFDPRKPSAASSERRVAACDGCAVQRHCCGVSPTYRAAHGDGGIVAYRERPETLGDQRTTAKRRWTAVDRESASRAEIQVLRPTVNCNQDCTFCSANETSGNVWVGREEMLRAIARAAQRGVERLSFSGGEPTLSRYLPEFIAAARRLAIPKVELITNGVLLDRREKAAALAEAGLTHAFVSLHAHSEGLSRYATQKIGDFDRTVAGIGNLIDSGVETAVNHVIHSRNYESLTRFVEFFHDRFHGKTKISFAFVTPQFKALDDLSVMPRLSDVKPHLKRALYRAVELGQPFNVGSRQGIPFCFLDEFRAWSDGIKQSNVARAEDAPQKVRAPQCDACRFSGYCNGLWRPYAARYGFDELQPIAGEPLSEKDAEAIHVAEREWPWGAPPSFDAVPKVLREPHLESGPPDVASVATPMVEDAFSPLRTRPLRLAMIGSGRQAERLARAIDATEGLSLDAVASPHAPEKDAAVFGNCPVYRDAEAALDDVRPDAVIVACATREHLRVTMSAVSRGIPVLLEKPVATAVEDVDALASLSEAHSVWILPAHNSLYAGGLQELLREPGSRGRTSVSWRRSAASTDALRVWSRGGVYELVYHLAAITGEVAGRGDEAEVESVVWSGDAAPERIRWLLRYPRGEATILVESGASAEEDLVRFESTDASRSWSWTRRGREISVEGRSLRPETSGSDVERMLARFRDGVLSGDGDTTDLLAARAVMRVAERCLEALVRAGAPFERTTAPKHSSSKELRRHDL